MNICFLANRVHPTAGGSCKYFYETAQNMKKLGHHVTMVCTNKISKADIDVDELICVPKVLGGIIQLNVFGLLAFLKLRNKTFDVYCFESGFIGGWILLFKLAKKRPLVSFSMRFGWNVLRLNLRDGPKLSFEFLHHIFWEISFMINEYFDTRLSDHIVVLNSEAKKVWCDHGYSGSKIEVMPYGVNLKLYNKQSKDSAILNELNLRTSDRVILYVGYLRPSRNVDILIRSFARLLENSNETVKLVLVGSGFLEKEYKSLVKQLNITNRVTFIAHIDDERKLSKIYNIGTLLVLPQVPGTTSMLAIACGLPVVSIRNNFGLLGAIDECILENFVLLDSYDPEMIATTCTDLLKNPDRLKQISVKGLDIAKSYSWEEVTLKLSKFLENVRKAH